MRETCELSPFPCPCAYRYWVAPHPPTYPLSPDARPPIPYSCCAPWRMAASCPGTRRRPFGTDPASERTDQENWVWRKEGGEGEIGREREIGCLPGDSDSWCCDADMADSRVRHCSPVCSASCRCTRGSQTVPAPSAVASPVCGIWRVDFETKPATRTTKKQRVREREWEQRSN